jgi:membrane protease YdiL (CAAX protease family)
VTPDADPPAWVVLVQASLAWALIAAAAGLALLAWPRPAPGEPAWARQRPRRIRWTMAEIILLAVFLLPVADLTAQIYLMVTAKPDYAVLLAGLGESRALLANGFSAGPASYAGSAAEVSAATLLKMRDRIIVLLWTRFFVHLAFLVAILALRWRVMQTNPNACPGLRRLRSNVVMGYLGWLVVTLPVWGILVLVQTDWLADLIGPPQAHPVELLLRSARTTDILVGMISILLIAPVLEEFLFRGLIQPMLARAPLLADAVILTALVMAVFHAIAAKPEDEVKRELVILFLIAAGPGYLLFEHLVQPWLTRPGAARAIFATSLLFAYVHMGAWPSPIPLFFLALVLGLVTYRTQSLVAPVTLHLLFNLMNVVILFVLPPLLRALLR